MQFTLKQKLLISASQQFYISSFNYLIFFRWGIIFFFATITIINDISLLLYFIAITVKLLIKCINVTLSSFLLMLFVLQVSFTVLLH